MGVGRPKGQPKYGGRKKGTLNKNAIPLMEKAMELGVDPFVILLLFAKGDWKSLGYEAPEFISGYGREGEPILKLHVTSDHRLTAASNAAKYLYPQLKAMELKVEAEPQENPLEGLSDEELDQM